MPYKIVNAGEEALAVDVNANYMAQTVARFPNAAARSAAGTGISAPPALNQMSILDDRPVQQRYNGTAWVDMPGALVRWAAINPNQGVAAATDFTLTTFAMPYAGSVHLFGLVKCGVGAGATTFEVAMAADPSSASVPVPSAAVLGAGATQPASNYNATFPYSALWASVAAGATVTIKVRVYSSAPATMGSLVEAIFGQILIVPTSF